MPAPPPGIAGALRLAAARLADSPSPRLDAEVLLAHVLGVARSYLYAWPEKPLAPAQAARFEALLARREAGEPVAYLTGEREFWGLNLRVTPATLVPRPDTEILVEQALARLPPGQPARVVDLGAGSGAVALAIAHERPACHVLAIDASLAALAVAQGNARRLGLRNVDFLAADWFAACGALRADLVVANPPYIAAADPHLAQGDVRYEPRSALVSGADGLDDLRRIVRQAPGHLAVGGWLLVEHGHDQAGAVAALLREAGYTRIVGCMDLQRRARVSGGVFPG